MSKHPSEFSRSGRQPIGSGVRPDRTGGLFGAGLLPGVSLISRGEAAGHGFWVDSDLLAQLASALQQATREGDGIKSRYTHPFASADSLGRFLGRVTALDEQATARALAAGWIPCDLHFTESAHRTPEGDLAGYLLDVAGEDPTSLGLSSVFRRDFERELAFMLAHGAELVTQPDGTERVQGFTSPDPDNVHNLPHARMAYLKAADVVGDPAANPGGLLGPVAGLSESDDFWAYALGVSNERPALAALDVDPDRLRGHLQNYLQRNQITLNMGADDMTRQTSNGVTSLDANGQADPPTPASPAAPAAPAAADASSEPGTPPADEPPAETPPAADATPATPASNVEPISQDEPPAAPAAGDQPAAEAAPAAPATPATPATPETVALSELPKWQKLGPNAMTWLSEGKTYQQALELRAAEQDAELTELRQLALDNRGEADPVSGNHVGQGAPAGPDTALAKQDRTAGFAQDVETKLARLNQPSSN